MTDDQREAFRIDADDEIRAELFYEGRVAPCALENLSAGGAKLTSALAMDPATQCTLGVRLGRINQGSGARYVSFLMEVLDAEPAPDGSTTSYRLRSLTAPGTPEYEEAARLVFEAQRRRLGAASGAGEASPMASDEERRRKLRTEQRPRFSKRSLRPGSGD